MRDRPASLPTVARLTAGILLWTLAPLTAARAFPFVDPTNQDAVANTIGNGIAPGGTELRAPDAQGLRNQLHLLNPIGGGAVEGWSIIPRFTLQEIFTDNAYDVTAPRRFDATTVLSPGISIRGESPRINLIFDYQPNLAFHAINGSLNALTQQLNMTGLVTIQPNLAYVDLRAITGVQSRLGGLGGAGALGDTAAALAPAGGGTYAGGAGGGLNRQNELQTSTFSISPYLLRQFGDYGTGKIGTSLTASRFAALQGFATSPLPSGGTNGTSLVSVEHTGTFTTGEFLGRLQAGLNLDLYQSNSHVDPATGLVGPNLATLPSTSFSSQRQSAAVQLSYVLNRTFSVQTSAGFQSIRYSNGLAPPVNGPTWSVGLTATPTPDTTAMIQYGHQNGATSLTANAHTMISGRTAIAVDYSNSIGTQLEHLGALADQSAINNAGQLVNAFTGGTSLFTGIAGIGSGNGVFRYKTLNLSANSTFPRDRLTAAVTWTVQTALTPNGTELAAFLDPALGQVFVVQLPVPGSNLSTDYKTLTVSWAHDLTPAVTFQSSAAYSLIRRPGALGNDGTLSTALGLRYTLSDTASVSARYSFFDRVSHFPGYSIYENLLTLGFTKTF